MVRAFFMAAILFVPGAMFASTTADSLTESGLTSRIIKEFESGKPLVLVKFYFSQGAQSGVHPEESLIASDPVLSSAIKLTPINQKFLHPDIKRGASSWNKWAAPQFAGDEYPIYLCFKKVGSQLREVTAPGAMPFYGEVSDISSRLHAVVTAASAPARV